MPQQHRTGWNPGILHGRAARIAVQSGASPQQSSSDLLAQAAQRQGFLQKSPLQVQMQPIELVMSSATAV